MKRYRLTVPEMVYADVRQHLLHGRNEEVAVLFANAATSDDVTNVIVRRWEPVPSAMLLRQAPDIFSVDSAFIVRHAKQAATRGESIVLAHSHPMDHEIPRFSSADDCGEADLYAFLQVRLSNRVHGALVMSPGGVAARFNLVDGAQVAVDEIRVVGRRVQRHRTCSTTIPHDEDQAHARQCLIWGSHGQRVLRDTTVALIGAGGTGSVVAQQLIHLGIGGLLVVDNQLVEESNLSRIVGARRDDIDSTPKVDVVGRIATAVDPSVNVWPIKGDVTDSNVLEKLKGVDVIFLCTDSHHSRAVVNAFAVQYVIPLIDLGFLIDIDEQTSQVIAAVGEVRVVVPGGYCLSCAGVLDADRIKAEKASSEERAAHPGYYRALDIPDPSVITLNSTIASLAVTIGCDMLIPTMRPVHPLDSYRYNAVKGIVAHHQKTHNPLCGICGTEGRVAMGDLLPLPQ